MDHQRILRIIKKLLLINRQGPYYISCLCWWRIKSGLNCYKTRERKKSYGKEMPDKTFYVIGINESWCGLFAILSHQLMHIAYAVERGYIPIVDMQNYDNQYLSLEKRFRENAWEYFFRQPMGYDLTGIKKAKNVIKSIIQGGIHNEPPGIKYRLDYTSLQSPDVLSHYKILFEKYIKFSDKSMNFLENKYNELLKNKGRVLGILCRGTDFTTLQPPGHPIQPEPTEVIKKAEKILCEYRCDYLYLATEDADIYDLFTDYFGDRLILDHSDKWRVTDLQGGKSNSCYNKSEKNERDINRGIEYLSQIYLLSQCTCFIGGATYGSLGALLMPNNFEYRFIYNLGFYA